MKRRRRKFRPATYAGIIARQKGNCACCGEPLGEVGDIEFDHALPLWLDGKDEPENLRAIIKGKGHHLDKTNREAAARAKCNRIQRRDGLRKARLNARQKALMKILEGQRA